MMVLSHSIITEILHSCLANERIFLALCLQKPGPLVFVFLCECLSAIKGWVCISLHVVKQLGMFILPIALEGRDTNNI